MKAIFYKKLIAFVCLSVIAPFYAMQLAKPEQTSLKDLPKEIQEMITLKAAETKPSQELLDKTIASLEGTSDEDAAAQLLAYSNEIGNVLRGIKGLGMTNKKLYQIVNNPKNTDYFIRTIAKNWAQDKLPVAIGLATPGAKQWIANYIETPEGLEKARALLFGSVNAGIELGAPFIYALKQAGLDINTSREFGLGWTALFYATQKGDIEMVKYLLKHGADKNRHDISGERAINYIPYDPTTPKYLELAVLLK